MNTLRNLCSMVLGMSITEIIMTYNDPLQQSIWIALALIVLGVLATTRRQE
jgi:predicted histidine transporter YuiF (NhaC family)